MFRRPNYVTREDIQNWNWQAVEKMLAQLAKAWPDIQVLLGGIDTQNFDPARLGESLAAEFTRLIDRLQAATTFQVRRITAKWAGLRTFAGDRTLVAGFDPRQPGFFWLAGQGGYGIQTAPAMGMLVASLITGTGLPMALREQEIEATALVPQ